MTGLTGDQLAARGLRRARRLRGAEEDPRGEDSAGDRDRRGQEVGAARPRRRRLSDGAQVELHAAAVPGREVSRLQFGRRRARHVQGPRHHAVQPARAVRGHGDRRLCDGLRARLQLRARRDLGDLRALRGGHRRGVRGRACSATTSSAPGFNFHLFNHHGYGAYICGEETALLESLEGKKGQPRFKPPFPASFGLYGKPTTINNTETFAAVPWIIRNGGDAFLNLGRPNNGGTKLFSVTGDVARPGNYEIRLGTPFAKLLEMAGGMRDGRPLKACIPGGSSMPVLPGAIMMATDMDYDSIAKAGSMLGSGAVILMNDTRCMVKSLLRPVVLLLRGVLRPVHAVPRRHGLAVARRRPDRARRGQERGSRPPAVGLRQHRRPHDLRAGRCGGAAGEELRRPLPRRIPAPYRPQAVPRADVHLN